MPLLVLAALGMLFAAGMLLYVMTYFRNLTADKVRLPASAWGSTALLLVLSFTIHSAVVNVRRERQVQMRRWLYATIALALAFLAVQTPCMVSLYHQLTAAQARASAQVTAGETAPHNPSGGAPITPIPAYGFALVLIFIHAMHVIGGLVAMAFVLPNAFRGRYDHEDYLGLRHAALYWHFLDAVWVVMFTVFLVTG